MGALENLSILKKLVAAFLVVISTSLLSNMIVWQNKNVIEESNAWTDHTYRVLGLMQTVMAAMVDQETGVRGFLVSGGENFLDPYKSGHTAFENAFKEVKQLTSDNPAQQGRLDQVYRLAQSWRNDVAAKEIELMRQPNTREQARAMEASGAGKTSMDGIRALVDQISGAEQVLLVKRKADQKQAFQEVRTAILGGTAFGIVLCCLSAFLLMKGISTPISGMTSAMHKLAGGDLSVDVPSKDRKDEVGQMAGAVQVFKDNALRVKTMEAEQKALEAKAATEKKAAMIELANGFEAQVGGVVATVSASSEKLQSSATVLSKTAEETSRQATVVAAASEQASTNVQTVASSAEELSSSISEISRQVSQSAKITGQAVEQVAQTGETIAALAQAAQKIGDVVKLISGIAGQTNLLALNATIEAARAGEAGKGFAVVASEVKSLATQTAKATDEIGSQISEIQNATSASVEAMRAIGATISEINEISAGIASAVEEQGAATAEIARNVQQAAAGTGEVSSNIAGVTKAAGETGGAAGDVQSAAGALGKQSQELRHAVDGFLAKVRAA